MTAKSPLEWLRAANPAVLERYATEWEQIGTDLEGVFQKYVDAVSKVDGQYWEGKAATAAHDRASGDQKTVQALADKLTGLAGQARTGVTTISEALLKARGLLNQCELNNWSVSSNLVVTGNGNARNIAQMNKDLTAAYNAAVATDNDLHDALNVTRGELVIAFTSAAALSGAQGKADGKDLITDPAHMTDAEIRRLVDAGQLTDDQLAKLHDGQPVDIPVAQMDYLNQIARSLDDKSPQEVQAILDKLPPDASAALRNSLQMISTSNITTTVKGDPAIPDHGDTSLLPKKIEQSLTRKDLVDTTPDIIGGVNVNKIALNGVADNQIIAKIAGGSDPRYRMGSGLDKQVLDVGAKYLNAQTTWEQKVGDGPITLGLTNKDIAFTVDGHPVGAGAPVTEGIFSAVADDKAAVQNLVIDAGTGKPNEQFFHDALTHKWSDGDKAVSSLFEFGNTDPNSVDGHRQASIMSAFAQFAAGDNAPSHIAGGDDKWKLYDIPGTDHQTVGQLNPKLMQTLSTSMSPYIDDLTNATHPTDDGFKVTYKGDDGLTHSWTDPSKNSTFIGAKNIFSLMDTDDTAGKTFNANALQSAMAQEVA